MTDRRAIEFEHIEDGEVFEDIDTGFAMVKTKCDYSGKFAGMDEEVDFNAVALGSNLVTNYEPTDIVNKILCES